MAKIGYAKIGRSWNLNPDKATSIGGDIDVINCLRRLAARYPQHEFVLVGKNSGEDPREFGYASNITNPWTEWKNDWQLAPEPSKADLIVDHFRSISGNVHAELDAMICWAGQHGSANSRIPMIGSDWDPGGSPGELYPDTDKITGGRAETLATPQYAFVHYVSWLLDLVSRFREAGAGPLHREEIWLCPDPRNYLKFRELRWPNAFPIQAQYDFLRYRKMERFGRFPPELTELDPTGYRDNSQWVTNSAYRYTGLELTAVGDPERVRFDPTPGRHRFGVVMNENLKGGRDSRLQLLKSWIMPHFPDCEVRGHWTEESQLDLNRTIEPVPYPEAMGVMKSFATTLTTPASSSEWATAKPWEAFAVGSVCFFHPRYDGQGYILPRENAPDKRNWSPDARLLGQFLRVSSHEELAQRVNEVTSNPELYATIVHAQRRHYEESFAHWAGGVRAIGDRIELQLGELETPILANAPWLEQPERPAAVVQGRKAARPRGTNEERKKRKPPVSRRRALRELPDADATNAVATEEPAVEASGTVLEGSALPEDVTVEYRPVTVSRKTRKEEPVQPPTTPFDMSVVQLAINAALRQAGLPVPDDAPAAKTDGPRESWDEFYLSLAEKWATRSTCARRDVGCILVDEHNHQLATGFNGVPRGAPHCNEGHPCSAAKAPSGTDLDGCRSAHAEVNALLRCADVNRIHTVYLTVSPCGECVKALQNTGAKRIVFREEYVHAVAKEEWLSVPGREWVKL